MLRGRLKLELIKMNTSHDEKLINEAITFIKACYDELQLSEKQQQERINEIEKEILQTGSYTHKTFELSHGAKMAWRNSNRCIGRLLWDTLHVFDERDIQTADEAFDRLKRHIEFATNNGKVRSAITIFPPRKGGKNPLRIWNHQLVRYAGYDVGEQVIGDSTSIKLTKMCQELGWESKKTPFDILPLVIQEDGKAPKLYNLPEEMIKEVPITHPEYPELGKLGVKWYAVPIITDMRLEIGGIDYPMAPFNGWYMETEIGARNLADEERYNLLPIVAEILGLDTRSNHSLWTDKALVELNIAVLHSYQEAGVTLVDHHTAAKQFKSFERKEKESGRKVTGNWVWLIPPVSPATTHIFHQRYHNQVNVPNYFYQKEPN